MVLTSDVQLSLPRFSASSIPASQHALNAELESLTTSGPRWYHVGAEKYRQMRTNGETSLPGRTVLPAGKDIQIPSRDPSRDIPCRVFLPTTTTSTPSAATFMHIHGGGWVLQSHLDFDPLLHSLATENNLAVVSVGYRLAPEHPFPAGPEDCYDAADWLAANAQHHFGAPLRFISGESAGAHLSLLTSLHLLSLPQPYTGVVGLVLHFGVYDLSALPSWRNFTRELILPRDVMEKYLDAFVPGHEVDAGLLKRPEVSPFYADLTRFEGRLPAAIFTCGTEDPLLDDSVFMGTRWMRAGARTWVKVYAGQPHGFVAFERERDEAVGEVLGHVAEFVKLCLE